MIPLYLTCLKIPESGRISWRIKVSSGKHGVCPKKPHHYDSIELSPVQSSPDPVRCPMAPGTHVKMKPVIFPRWVFWLFGYFSILFFLLSPSFHKAAQVPWPSFPAAARCQFPLGLGLFSVEQDEPPSPDFTAKVRDRWIWECLLPVDALLGTREQQQDRNQEGGAEP